MNWSYKLVIFKLLEISAVGLRFSRHWASFKVVHSHLIVKLFFMCSFAQLVLKFSQLLFVLLNFGFQGITFALLHLFFIHWKNYIIVFVDWILSRAFLSVKWWINLLALSIVNSALACRIFCFIWFNL